MRSWELGLGILLFLFGACVSFIIWMSGAWDNDMWASEIVPFLVITLAGAFLIVHSLMPAKSDRK